MAGSRYLQFYQPSGAGLRPQITVAEHDKYQGSRLDVNDDLYHGLAEIIRVTALVGNSTFLDQDGLDHGSPISSGVVLSEGLAGNQAGWGGPQSDSISTTQGTLGGWYGAQGASAPGGLRVKKTQRIEVPVDKYPNFNFVGRLLGPRGNSLKRVEATTGCRVLIRGRGSIKDGAKEDKMRDKPGFEHLNEPLHLLVEAELPSNIVDNQLSYARDILEELLKPMDETLDLLKKAQLRELAILNGTLRDESPGYMDATPSPFNNPGMKRAKTWL